MTIRVQKPGLQTTIQSRPRTGLRHLGVPASGPADPLSMALANRLVGNASLESALETTLTGVTLAFAAESTIAITGATAKCSLNGEAVQQHATISVRVLAGMRAGHSRKVMNCTWPIPPQTRLHCKHLPTIDCLCWAHGLSGRVFPARPCSIRNSLLPAAATGWGSYWKARNSR